MQKTETRWIQLGASLGGLAALISLGLFVILSGSDPTSIVPGVLMYFALALLGGAGYGWLLRTCIRLLETYEGIVFGVVYGVASWLFFGLVVVPVVSGMGPQWNAGDAAGQFPLLMIYLLQGVILALAFHGMQTLGWLRIIESPHAIDELETDIQQRVVILGGGFAGVTTAQELEKRLGDHSHVQITLVSQTNHLLFTPMLAEVTAGGVEAQHISPPLRAFFRRVRVIRGEPTEIIAAENTVAVKLSSGSSMSLAYDHLVLALGAVPNFGSLPKYSW